MSDITTFLKYLKNIVIFEKIISKYVEYLKNIC